MNAKHNTITTAISLTNGRDEVLTVGMNVQVLEVGPPGSVARYRIIGVGGDFTKRGRFQLRHMPGLGFDQFAVRRNIRAILRGKPTKHA